MIARFFSISIFDFASSRNSFDFALASSRILFADSSALNLLSLTIVLILGYMGAMPAEGTYLLIARIATAYYFIHFLVILPVLGKRERTLEVPLSITEPVLGGLSNPAMAKNSERLKSLG